ncbi:MAG: hypothetical protein LBJ35_04555 [Spirochaetaceae bacterium]|jgi:hypothetical protein|nr:hypothetical protein [Spirochaetaceae bacterium]
MEVNREYKDSVFSLLFNNKERLLELYNAIEGTNYTDAGDIKINTLQDIGLVQQPGWVVSQVLQNALHFAVSSGCCSITEVIEQFYYISGQGKRRVIRIPQKADSPNRASVNNQP